MTSRMSTAMPVMMRPVKIPIIGATRSHFWISREYVAVRSSLTRAVYFRSSGCLRNLDSRTFAKIPNEAILSRPRNRRRTSHLAILMFNTMYRRGTVAATHVAKLPQASRRGTPTEPMIRQRMQNGTDVQRPNLEFAAYRGLQVPSQYHMSARRIVPRLAVASSRTLRKWHGNWIISRIRRISPGFVRTTLVDEILKSAGPDFAR